MKITKLIFCFLLSVIGMNAIDAQTLTLDCSDVTIEGKSSVGTVNLYEDNTVNKSIPIFRFSFNQGDGGSNEERVFNSQRSCFGTSHPEEVKDTDHARYYLLEVFSDGNMMVLEFYRTNVFDFTDEYENIYINCYYGPTRNPEQTMSATMPYSSKTWTDIINLYHSFTSKLTREIPFDDFAL